MILGNQDCCELSSARLPKSKQVGGNEECWNQVYWQLGWQVYACIGKSGQVGGDGLSEESLLRAAGLGKPWRRASLGKPVKACLGKWVAMGKPGKQGYWQPSWEV